jgi:hypothetical protein
LKERGKTGLNVSRLQSVSRQNPPHFSLKR